MSDRVALIENGVVTAIIWKDADLGEDVLAVSCPAGNGVDPGWRYESGAFLPPTAPIEPVPQSVSRQQMMAALMLAGLITEAEWLACYQSGTLPALVAAAIATLPTDAAKLIAKVKWVEFSEAHRADAMVALLAAQAGLTETQVDDMFRTAAAL